MGQVGKCYLKTVHHLHWHSPGGRPEPDLLVLVLQHAAEELRNNDIGCHLAGRWVGATMYADDLILLAPTRTAMAAMLKVCELTHRRPVARFCSWILPRLFNQ